VTIRGLARATGIHAVAFSPDAKALATGAYEDEAALASFSPHGGLLASASQDGEIRLWDLAAGRWILGYWTGMGRTPRALAFSRSGDLLGMTLSFLVPTEPAVLLGALGGTLCWFGCELGSTRLYETCTERRWYQVCGGGGDPWPPIYPDSSGPEVPW